MRKTQNLPSKRNGVGESLYEPMRREGKISYTLSPESSDHYTHLSVVPVSEPEWERGVEHNAIRAED